jgi:hypothetical protein
MKKSTLLIMAFAAQINFAQSTFPVGTLQINNDGVYDSSISSGGVARMKMGFDGAKGYITFGAHTGSGQREDILYMRGSDGNVGIGTSNPQQKFVVSNNGAEGFELYLDQLSSIVGLQSYNRILNTYSKMQLDASQFSFMNGNVGIGTLSPQQRFVVSNNGAEGFELYLDKPLSLVGLQSYNRVLNTYSKMQLDASQFSFMHGNVGIGTINPLNKLDVKGTIHSQEVKVDMLNWSDFVFKKEYNLPTLEEVEKHITEKGHLENIPNEKEVLEKGINLGEMNAKLLQKVEELTLYMIEQNKRMNKLEKDNQELKNKVDLIKEN